MSKAASIIKILLEDDSQSLLQDFVDLNLRNAPAFKVDQNVRCNDIDQIGGPAECLPVAVVSYDTMQKYIVPRNNSFLVPVPVGSNWRIYRLSHELLRNIIERLRTMPEASLDDFYEAASSGEFFRDYY